MKNLSIVVNLAKKSKSIKLKKTGLPNIKANSETDFLTPKAKKAFIHLQKAFTKAPIFRHFDPECYIWIETNALEYAISRVLSQINSDYLDDLDDLGQLFSNYVTHKNLDLIFSKFKIGQWHLIVFFSQKMIPAET